MEITVYSGFSKRINSTKQPSGGTAKEVRLKEPTSVINPTFIISGFDLSWNYIKWGSRYFFVDDIMILTNTQAAYSCSLDVLATYKDVIGNSSEYVVRAASAYNGDIVDALYPTKNRPTGITYTPVTISTAFNGIGTFVIGVRNGKGETGISFYTIDAANMLTLVDYMFNDGWLTASDITVELQKLISDPMDYIVSCYWYPFTISAGAPRSIWFGYWDSGAAGKLLSESNRIYSVSDTVSLQDHPQISRGAYLNGSPFTRITADIYGFGRVPLDANMFINSRSMLIGIKVDLFTGLGELLINSSVGRVAKVSAMVGVPVQLSQTTQDLIKPVLATMQGASSLLRENYVGAAASFADAVTSCKPQVQSSGSIGSKIAYATDPNILVEWYSVVDEDNTTLGRPLAAIRTINTLSGYIKCENVDINSVGTKAEKTAIINFMESGFFYE